MSYIGTEPKDIRSFGRTQFDYTATQGQTAFTGADDDGKVLAFTTGQINVFVNGILMDDSDFTTTGTGTVTLASAANLNDVISIVSFESNIPDNDYVPASGGTFTGNVTNSGTVTNSGNVTVGGTLGITGATTMAGALTGTSAGFTGDVNIGNNDASNPVSKLRLGATLYGAADIVPVSTGHKIGLDFKTDSTGDTTIDPVTRMSISNEGYITTPFQPAILASASSIQTFSSTATATAMTLGTTNFSRGNLTRSGNNLTVPVTGYYVFNYAIAANIFSNIRAFGVRLYQNGSGLQAHNYHAAYWLGGSAATHYEFTGTFLVSLSANDYVTLYGILYDTTSNINFQTQINGYLIG